MVVGESRTELLQWLNQTLDLNYTKVEKCGTGAVYCQLMDCIYGNVPMHKVKFENAITEYDYRNNMKILQAAFNKHGITKSIDVERLVKCRLQDNLELLQWFKRQWLEKKDVNDDYDAKSIRKSTPSSSNLRTASKSTTSAPPSRNITPRRASPAVNPVSKRIGSNNSLNQKPSISNLNPSTPHQQQQQQPNNKVQQLNKDLQEANIEIGGLTEELQEYKISVESLETERNFYFNKLREIEILTQNIQEQEYRLENGNLNNDDIQEQIANLTVSDITKQIQSILYSTEEGFDDGQTADDDIIDSESF